MMKTLLSITLLFCSFFVSSQNNYHFDYQIEQYFKNASGIWESEVKTLVNSKDHHLMLHIFKKNEQENPTAILIDHNKNLTYDFMVGQEPDNDHFILREKRPLKDLSHQKYGYIEIVKNSELNYTINLKRKKKAKRYLFQFVVQLEQNIDDLIYIRHEQFNYFQTNEIQNALKNQLQRDGELGNFHIAEIKIDYPPHSSYQIVTKPLKKNIQIKFADKFD